MDFKCIVKDCGVVRSLDPCSRVRGSKPGENQPALNNSRQKAKKESRGVVTSRGRTRVVRLVYKLST